MPWVLSMKRAELRIGLSSFSCALFYGEEPSISFEITMSNRGPLFGSISMNSVAKTPQRHQDYSLWAPSDDSKYLQPLHI